MLSYQHAYHAGNRADIHKHSLLVSVLDSLIRKNRPVTYIETHAGRGIYDLNSVEARKTGEAASGWMDIEGNEAALAKLPKKYVEAVRALNDGGLSPFYPGSPFVASYILRPQDHIYLMELHPQEYAALAEKFREDKRCHIHKRDGLEGALALSPPENRRGLVLVDPSYELKEEYETIPDFAVKLARKWPEASILIWIPMLPAGRHEVMVEKLKRHFPGVPIFQEEWPKTGAGMYGSIIAGINLPYGV